ncbi:DUF4282 domain-containing protein [Malaciobacter canalis]|jgi:hypothetical protein|uniref:DUF4282 domain-containing protein n=1 Tax=Malaciobacter canalis TaxID=1912871 RepID=UPI00384BBFD6
MKSLLFFDSMLTPKIVTVLYWVLLFTAVVVGLGQMFSGYNGFSISNFFTGVLVMIGGAIGARIWCELMIVIFKINENLQVIKEQNKKD